MSLLDALSNQIVNELNDYINQEAKEANQWMEEAGFSQEDKDIVEKYRHGYCGVSCDLALDFLKNKEFDIKKLEKVNPISARGDTHFFLQEGDKILEPSYKQFLYKLVLDPSTGVLRDHATPQDVKVIDNLPGVYCGKMSSYQNLIKITLNKIKQEDKINDILVNYGIDHKPIESYKEKIAIIVNKQSEASDEQKENKKPNLNFQKPN